MNTNKPTSSLLQRRLTWLILNVGQIYLTYTWLFQSQEWAGNTLKFMTAWIAFTAIMCLTKPMREHCRKEGRSMPAWATGFFDIGLALALASQAHFIMAGIIMFSLLAEGAAYDLPYPGEDDPKAP